MRKHEPHKLTSIVERLLEWRKRNRLSQRQAHDLLARRYNLPVSLRALQSWEQGTYRPGKMAELVLQAFLHRHAVITNPPARYPGYRPRRSEEDKAKMREMYAHGMTHEQIGEKFGIGYSAVSRILSGKPRTKAS